MKEREKRTTAGLRMSSLMGEEAEKDQQFWGHDTWNEEQESDYSDASGPCCPLRRAPEDSWGLGLSFSILELVIAQTIVRDNEQLLLFLFTQIPRTSSTLTSWTPRTMMTREMRRKWRNACEKRTRR
jgi:hypothetical protein